MKTIKHGGMLLLIVANFMTMGSMEMSSSESKKRKAIVELINENKKKPKISCFSNLPDELKLMIFGLSLEDIAKDNSDNAFKAFCQISKFLKSIFLVDKDFKRFKIDLIKIADNTLSKYFAKKYSNLSPGQKNSQLIEMIKYSREKRKAKITELLIAGANPRIMVNYGSCIYSTFLDVILKTGKFTALIPLLLKYGINICNYYNDGFEHDLILAIKLQRKYIIEQLLHYRYLNINCVNLTSDGKFINALGAAIYVNDMESISKIMAREDFELNHNLNIDILKNAIIVNDQNLISKFFNHKNFNKLLSCDTCLLDFINNKINIVLWEAIEIGNLNLVKTILINPSFKVDINNFYNGLYILLSFGFGENRAEIFKEILSYLYANNNDLNFRSGELKNFISCAISYALQHDNWEIVNVLCTLRDLYVDFIGDSDKLYQILRFAVANNNAELVKKCLLKDSEVNIDVNRKDCIAFDVDLYNGKSVLSIAFELNNCEIINLLCFMRPISVDDINDSDQLSQVLKCALMNNNVELIEKCLIKGREVGMDINFKDRYGRTPLMYAVLYNNIKSVWLLLNYPGIDVYGFDAVGHTALSLATLNNYLDIAKLIANYLDVDIKISNNRNLDLNVLRKKYQDILDFMD